ncbi:hypothetical protein EV182_004288, partial [Spiromyces aspiralis]
AEELAREFGSMFAGGLSVLPSLDGEELPTPRPAVVIGTVPATGLQIAFPDALFAEPGLALDMAYKPRITPLLAAAERHGWTTIPGVQVLIDQGVEQCERWTGFPAPYNVMHEAVMAYYNQQGN